MANARADLTGLSDYVYERSATGLTEVSRQGIRPLKLSAPRRPSLLADSRIAI
jgi:hypothetical protein